MYSALPTKVMRRGSTRGRKNESITEVWFGQKMAPPAVGTRSRPTVLDAPERLEDRRQDRLRDGVELPALALGPQFPHERESCTTAAPERGVGQASMPSRAAAAADALARGRRGVDGGHRRGRRRGRRRARPAPRRAAAVARARGAASGRGARRPGACACRPTPRPCGSGSRRSCRRIAMGSHSLRSSETKTRLPSDFDIFSPSIRTIAWCIQWRTNGSPVAASDWARSHSWCGKIRSLPPPCRSMVVPSSRRASAEHSMCQPGSARAPQRLPRRLVGRATAARARSRAGRACAGRRRCRRARRRTRASRSRRVARHRAEVRERSRRRSRRRRRPGRRGPGRAPCR